MKTAQHVLAAERLRIKPLSVSVTISIYATLTEGNVLHFLKTSGNLF